MYSGSGLDARGTPSVSGARLSLTLPDFDVTLLPLELLHAELSRRQDAKPACGSAENHGTYNTGLHVFALFLILILSTLGKQEGRTAERHNR